PTRSSEPPSVVSGAVSTIRPYPDVPPPAAPPVPTGEHPTLHTAGGVEPGARRAGGPPPADAFPRAEIPATRRTRDSIWTKATLWILAIAVPTALMLIGVLLVTGRLSGSSVDRDRPTSAPTANTAGTVLPTVPSNEIPIEVSGKPAKDAEDLAQHLLTLARENPDSVDALANGHDGDRSFLAAFTDGDDPEKVIVSRLLTGRERYAVRIALVPRSDRPAWCVLVDVVVSRGYANVTAATELGDVPTTGDRIDAAVASCSAASLRYSG
ncbi:MAG: hypothetical protein R2705_12115, partial [Ilumatobacteraceae bacterium]